MHTEIKKNWKMIMYTLIICALMAITLHAADVNIPATTLPVITAQEIIDLENSITNFNRAYEAHLGGNTNVNVIAALNACINHANYVFNPSRPFPYDEKRKSELYKKVDKVYNTPPKLNTPVKKRLQF
jgi:hypothetical protein